MPHTHQVMCNFSKCFHAYKSSRSDIFPGRNGLDSVIVYSPQSRSATPGADWNYRSCP